MAGYSFITDLETKYTVEYQYLSERFLTDGLIADQNSLLLSIDKAYKAICKYIGFEDAYDGTYMAETICLADAYFNLDILNRDLLKGNRTVTQMAQGSRSVTYGSAKIELDSYGLTEDVRAMLPIPKLKVI